jgi:hypothetical protein
MAFTGTRVDKVSGGQVYGRELSVVYNCAAVHGELSCSCRATTGHVHDGSLRATADCSEDREEDGRRVSRERGDRRVPPRDVGVGGESHGLHRLARGRRRWPELTGRHKDLDPAPVGDDLKVGRRQQPTQPEADLEIVLEPAWVA